MLNVGANTTAVCDREASSSSDSSLRKKNTNRFQNAKQPINRTVFLKKSKILVLDVFSPQAKQHPQQGKKKTERKHKSFRGSVLENENGEPE